MSPSFFELSLCSLAMCFLFLFSMCFMFCHCNNVLGCFLFEMWCGAPQQLAVITVKYYLAHEIKQMIRVFGVAFSKAK